MKIIIEKSKYLSLLAVITLLLTFALTLFWGIAQAVKVWGTIILSLGQSPDVILLILKLIDAFLVAMVLYILAASLHELFVSKLELPSALVAKSLAELKSKLSSMIVLVLAVHSVEVIFDEGIPALEKVWQVVAISLIAVVLIAFSYFGASHEQADI
ncbi:MAG: YqhA family protein [Chloroflexi bacterium]|nr:YqhA family protein [Chloroflexota bacterium]